MPASTVTVASSTSTMRSRWAVESSIPSVSAMRLNECRVPSGFNRAELAISSCASSTERGASRRAAEYVTLPAQFFIPGEASEVDGAVALVCALLPPIQECWSAGGCEVRRALAPARGQRVEDDHAQRQCRETPQRVLAVAEEAELGDEVQAHEQDREPPCPPLSGQ